MTSDRKDRQRCEDCRHWSRSPDEPQAGECRSPKFIYAGRYRGGRKQRVTPVDGLRYWDYEGYSASFSTGESFGCIHWECITSDA